MRRHFVVAALGFGLDVVVAAALNNFTLLCLFWACCLATLVVFLNPYDMPPHELD